jgi:hypothetical protein
LISSVLGNGVQFRAISEGSWERLASTSGEVAVAVDPALTLTGATLTSLGRSETFTATVTPTRAKATIILERFDRKKSGYLEVARAKTDATGSAAFALTSPAGFHSYRARLVVKGQDGVSAGSEADALVSPVIWVTVVK